MDVRGRKLDKNVSRTLQAQKPNSYLTGYNASVFHDTSDVEVEDARKRVAELKRKIRVKLLRRTVNLDFFV